MITCFSDCYWLIFIGSDSNNKNMQRSQFGRDKAFCISEGMNYHISHISQNDFVIIYLLLIYYLFLPVLFVLSLYYYSWQMIQINCQMIRCLFKSLDFFIYPIVLFL